MKKHTQKEYIVIGLGRFGTSVAKQLEANGCKVLAIDRDEKKIITVVVSLCFFIVLRFAPPGACEKGAGHFCANT